ncbi:MAG: response regulator [Candidatus Sumerlaeia bacterium]
MNGEPLKVLLVEDNPDHAELVRRSFEDHCVTNTIFHVQDGEEALDYLFQRNKYDAAEKCPRPHLVLLDLRLPKVDGLQVLKEIKTNEKLKSIPVVVLTTSNAERDLAGAYEHYVNSYLTKPVDFQKFTELMKILGFYWLGWNEYR